MQEPAGLLAAAKWEYAVRLCERRDRADAGTQDRLGVQGSRGCEGGGSRLPAAAGRKGAHCRVRAQPHHRGGSRREDYKRNQAHDCAGGEAAQPVPGNSQAGKWPLSRVLQGRGKNRRTGRRGQSAPLDQSARRPARRALAAGQPSPDHLRRRTQSD